MPCAIPEIALAVNNKAIADRFGCREALAANELFLECNSFVTV